MKIDGFQEKYHSRFLGFVYNSYTRRVEKIYDVYDGDIESTKQAKNQTKQQFERGVEKHRLSFPVIQMKSFRQKTV